LALAGEAEVTELCMAHESTPVIKPLGPHFGLATLSDSVEGGGIGALRWKNRQFGTIKVLLTMGSCAQGVHDIRVHIDKSCGRLIRLLTFGGLFLAKMPRCANSAPRRGNNYFDPKTRAKEYFPYSGSLPFSESTGTYPCR
jgi:hypothetical protein